MDGIFHIVAADPGFFDKTFLYISGGLLVAFAVLTAFLGLTREDFPSRTQLRAVSGIAVLLVVCTLVGAINNARFEQSERRAKNQEAATESQAESTAKQEAQAPQGEGQGAAPTPSGEASGGGGQGGGQSGGAALAEGKKLFTDNGCGSCHTLADAGTTGQIGPNLDQVLPGMSEDQIRTSIVDPSASIAKGYPDGVMPQNFGDQLNEAQLDTLVAYLHQVAGQ